MGERLAYLARRVEGDPFFLAAALAAYARGEGLDEDGLARALGCGPEVLPLLRLCRRPRPEPPAFRADVARIAERFGLEPTVLAEIVRRAAALAALRGPAAGGTARDGAGLLLAARDRDDDDATPPNGDAGGRP